MMTPLELAEIVDGEADYWRDTDAPVEADDDYAYDAMMDAALEAGVLED
jgi:hypothetical protein